MGQCVVERGCVTQDLVVAHDHDVVTVLLSLDRITEMLVVDADQSSPMLKAKV